MGELKERMLRRMELKNFFKKMQPTEMPQSMRKKTFINNHLSSF